MRGHRGIWSESGPVRWRRHFASRWPPTPIASKIETHSLPGNYVTVTFLADDADFRCGADDQGVGQQILGREYVDIGSQALDGLRW